MLRLQKKNIRFFADYQKSIDIYIHIQNALKCKFFIDLIRILNKCLYFKHYEGLFSPKLILNCIH